MSNRSCNKCVAGKVELVDNNPWCIVCILRSGFKRSPTPVRILKVRPGIKDDRV